jgi:hypothetical protein
MSRARRELNPDDQLPTALIERSAERGTASAVHEAQSVTISVNIDDVLEGHVALDISCVDRLYPNAYVPNIQVGGQVVRFMTHLGLPVPVLATAAAVGGAAQHRSLREEGSWLLRCGASH